MYANIQIIGNVGKDPEKRSAGSTDLASFSVATTRKVKQDKVTTWFSCTVWGKQADIIMNYVKRGDKIMCTGELSTREHDGKTYLEVNVRDFVLLGSKSDSQQDTATKTDSGVAMADDSEIPF
jgi:single-strand DNA-binding protein